jgi:hypothetical protein
VHPDRDLFLREKLFRQEDVETEDQKVKGWKHIEWPTEKD